MNEKFIQPKLVNEQGQLILRDGKRLIPVMIEIFERDGQWRGQIHEAIRPSDAVRLFRHAHDLRGTAAHLIIVSHDSRASYAIALEFASSIASGSYSYRRIDLSSVQGKLKPAKSNKKGQMR